MAMVWPHVRPLASQEISLQGCSNNIDLCVCLKHVSDHRTHSVGFVLGDQSVP